MAAEMQIHEMSAIDAGVDKTSGVIRFKDADNATVDGVNPLVKPAAGSIYSYTKTLRAWMEVPPTTEITDLGWYSDGTSGMGTGIGITMKNVGVTYVAHYKTAMSGGTDFFTKTSASIFDGDATDAGPFVPADDESYVGDGIDFQMSVASTASQGALAAEAVTFTYDEV